MKKQSSVGERIAEIREQAGLTQTALARAVGTSQSAISQIEAGERNPSYDMLEQIGKAMGMSTAHLVGAPIEGLTSEELAHFRQYKSLPVEAKRELQAFAQYLQHKYSPKHK